MSATIDGTSNPTTTRPHKRHRRDDDQELAVTRLVLSGVPTREIGQVFEIATRGAVNRLVERALRSQLPELDADLRRRVDLARLEALVRAWWDRALDGDAQAASILLTAIALGQDVAGRPTGGHLGGDPTGLGSNA